MHSLTPSDAAVATLLRGDPLSLSSGKLVVEKLGPTAKRLLGLLWSSRNELGTRKPADQATHVRALYTSVSEQLLAGVVGDSTPAVPPVAPAPRWRLDHLVCQSVRGIAPFGETFEFPIGRESVLIYGPNGTGKSSLVNAIGWVFTGRVATDCESDSETITLYAPAKAGGRPTKLCDWPVANTLPHGSDPKRVKPNYTAVLVLKSEDGRRTLHLRRSAVALEESGDGVAWQPCPDLAAHGISPLDVQLSISAATVFGRRSLESSPDTRHLLSMMLGYDAIEELGGLVTNLAAALTKAANAEADEIAGRKLRLREKLLAVSGALRFDHPLVGMLTTLAGDTPPTPERIEEVRAAADAAASIAEAELARTLGIDPGGTIPAGVAEAATVAVTSLGRSVPDLFPSLASLAPDVNIEAEGGPHEPIPLACAAELEAFEVAVRAKVVERLAWWREETEPGSRAGLFIQAAAYFEPDRHQCPVCDQSVSGLSIERRLSELKGATAELRAELRVFFRDLIDELGRIVPAAVRGHSTADPAVLVRTGWERLKKALGPSLGGLTSRYDDVVAALAGGVTLPAARAVNLVPADAEPEFREAAGDLERAVSESWRGIAVATWAASHFPALAGKLRHALTAPEVESLYSVLAKGRHAAADVSPLKAVRDELAAAAGEASALIVAEAGLVSLHEIRGAIEEVKHVGKYAEAEVEHVFGDIKDATAAHFGRLYPHANPDLVLARLHLNKGRDKSVEAYLAAGGFEFPGQQVANAGCIRAVALAFYFALLGRHPGGLGFVVMDDPILSLDENHREAWASNVLRPCLAATQIILATHQRQFLINCRSDFRPGRIVELNPRTRSRRVTWRPGDRLDNTDRLLATDWNNAAIEMRKYREEVLITLDAYSPVQFFTRKNFKDSLNSYAALSPPNPLAGPNARLAARLRDEKVARVLDPGSHALTEADVTEPMVRACLRELVEFDEMFRKELDRLEEVRLRELRSKAAPADAASAEVLDDSAPNTIPVEMLRVGDDAASWRDPLALKIIGTAAAQTRGCVVDLAELPRGALFPAGGAVLIVGDGLAPLARPGQWALLADPSVRITDGDYAAVKDQAGNHFLRRIWSAGDAWLLESINPLAGTAPVRVRKCTCLARKVTGVSFANAKEPKLGTNRLAKEWHTRQDFSSTPLVDLFGITIRGTSLEPIACDEHVVVVGRKIDSRFDAVRRGSLAVVETDDPRVGNVIKRVYPEERSWVLLSPNPVDPRDPLTVAKSKLRAVWPVQGVLFTLSIDDG